MKKVLIIATSLNEASKSQILARQLEAELKVEAVPVELFDLREKQIPITGSGANWGSADATSLEKAVLEASHIVFSVPIYCYDVNAAAKNVIEQVGRAFTKKVVGFMCSAGGANSYMSVLGFANHLMLDFRSVIVPRFLYVDPSGWDGEELKTDVHARLKGLISDLSEVNVTTGSSN